MRQVTTIALAVSLVSLGACARRTPPAAATTTSAQVLSSGYREAEKSARAITRGEYDEALARADHAAILTPNNAWAHYDRAVALHHLGRADAAIAAYRDAELRFSDDPWGKSLAVYGRARTLDIVGRCDEARQAYEEYANLVRPRDARAADMAIAYARQCHPLESPAERDPVLAEMTSALTVGDYAKVVELHKTRSPSAPPNPWIDYDLGAALTGLGCTEEALAAFRRAEAAFDQSPEGRRGRAVAIWGRARALDADKRCREATAAYDEYVKVVGPSDPDAARLAATYARTCPLKT